MSKIEKELVKATDVEQKRGEERGEFLARLGKAVGALAEKAWDGLSEAAQDWFNANADARNAAKKAGKTIPDWTDFPDAVAEEEEQPRSRRRSDDDGDEKPAKSGKATGGPDLLKEGLVCVIETTRGKTYEGTVIELTKDDVVIKTDKDEVEISIEKVAKVTHETAAEAAPAAKKGGKAAKEEAVEPHEGAEVKVTTKRGKEITGTITEMTDDEIVVKTADDVEELRRDRIETIQVLKAKAGSKKEADEPAPKKGAKKEAEGDGDEKPARTRNVGVSIGTRITELMAANMEATEEEIAKLLKKEKLEFKENTLSLNYAATKKTFDILKGLKLLKA